MNEFDDIRTFLASQTFVQMLDSLREERATGYLGLKTGRREATFFIDGGRLALAADDDGESIEKALVAIGYPEKKIQRAARKARKDESLLTAAFQDDLGATAEIQASALGTWLLERFLLLASSDHLSHDWKEGALVPDRHVDGGAEPRGAVDLGEVIVQIPEEWNDEHVLAKLHASVIDVYRNTVATRQLLDDGELDPAIEEIVRLVDGERDVGEIVRASGASRFDSMGTIYVLVANGYLEPRPASDLVEMAAEYRRNGRLDKALRLYRRAEGMGGGPEDLAETIGGIYEMMGEREEAVETYVHRARKCLEDGKPEAARSCYEKILKLHPAHGEAVDELKKLYFENENDDAGIEMLRRQAKLSEQRGDEDAMAASYREIVHLGRADAALIERFAPLLTKLSGADEARSYLAAAAVRYDKAGEPATALACVDFVLHLDPNSAANRVRRASLLRQNGSDKEAITELVHVLESLDSGEATDAHAGLFEEACESILDIDPKRAEIRRRLADLYVAVKKDEKALRHFHHMVESDAADVDTLERIVRLDATDLVIRARLADALTEAGRRDEAARVTYDLATAKRKAGDRAAAAELLQRTLELNPLHLRAHREHCEILAQRGETEEARKELGRLVLLCRGAGLEEEAFEASQALIDQDLSDLELVMSHAALVERTSSNAVAAERLTELAKRAKAEDRVGLALSLVERALRCEPDHSHANKLRSSLQAKGDASAAVELERIYRENADTRIKERVGELEEEYERRAQKAESEIERSQEKRLSSARRELEEEVRSRITEAEERATREADESIEKRARTIDDRIAAAVAEKEDGLRKEMEEALRAEAARLAREAHDEKKKQSETLDVRTKDALKKRLAELEAEQDETYRNRVEQLKQESDRRTEERAKAAEEEVEATLESRRRELELEMEQTLAEKLRELGEAADRELEERRTAIETELREQAERAAAAATEHEAAELARKTAELEEQFRTRFSERETELRGVLEQELAKDRERLAEESRVSLEERRAQIERAAEEQLAERKSALEAESEERFAARRSELEAEFAQSLEAKRVESEEAVAQKQEELRAEFETKTSELEDAHAAKTEELETAHAERTRELNEAHDGRTTALEAGIEKRRKKLEAELKSRREEVDAELVERREELEREQTERVEKLEAEHEARDKELREKAEAELEERRNELVDEFHAKGQEQEDANAAALEEKIAAETERLEAEAAEAAAARKAELEKAADETLAERQTALAAEFQQALTQARDELTATLRADAAAAESARIEAAQAELESKMGELERHVAERIADEEARLAQEAQAAYDAKKSELEALTDAAVAEQEEKIRVSLGNEATDAFSRAAEAMKTAHAKRMKAVDNEVLRRIAQKTAELREQFKAEVAKEEQRLKSFYAIKSSGNSGEIEKVVMAELEKRTAKLEDEVRDRLEKEHRAKLEAESGPETAKVDESIFDAPKWSFASVNRPATPKPQPAPAPNFAAGAPEPMVMASGGDGESLNPNDARNKVLSNDLISSAAAAIKNVQMAGAGGGGGGGGGGMSTSDLGGIVGKLKSVQMGGGAPSGGDGTTVSAQPAMNDAVAKLKAMKMGGSDGSVTKAQPAMNDAMAKLKAMKKAAAGGAAPGAPAAPGGDATETKPPVDDAVAKLKALGAGGLQTGNAASSGAADAIAALAAMDAAEGGAESAPDAAADLADAGAPSAAEAVSGAAGAESAPAAAEAASEEAPAAEKPAGVDFKALARQSVSALVDEIRAGGTGAGSAE